MANKENQPPKAPAPLLSSISPSNKPALSRQRDHSACKRPATPLKVRKTRENLKQLSLYADIPPPCVHDHNHDERHPIPDGLSAIADVKNGNVHLQRHEYSYQQDYIERGRQSSTCITPQSLTPPAESRMQRQKSVSRRMLTRVKQGIAGRSKNVSSVKPTESDTSLVRRLSGRQKQSSEAERRSQSFDVGRGSLESGIDEGPETVSLATTPAQRSFTDSTVSTAEVLGDSPSNGTLNDQPEDHASAPVSALSHLQSWSPRPPSSPSPQPTPRPPPKQKPPTCSQSTASTVSVTVPCIDLYVALESTTIDVHSKRDVWVAIEATVRSMCSNVGLESTKNLAIVNDDDSHTGVAMCGGISSLRLCFKPVDGCSVREIVGEKTCKDLTLGQQCSLFIKVRVPKIRVRDSAVDPDQDSLFTELESIVGTLKTEIMHVEARYRHSMLPSDNVVTVRQICKIKRPKISSRWSLTGLEDKYETSTEVYAMLARYLTSHHSSQVASKLLLHYVGAEGVAHPSIRQTFETLAEELRPPDVQRTMSDEKPSVIITDIDFDGGVTLAPAPMSRSTSRTTALGLETAKSDATYDDGKSESNLSMVTTSLALPLISRPKTTTALNIDASPSMIMKSPDNGGEAESLDSQDSARQLWRHIRRTSLSAKQLQEEMTPERLQTLEASDEHLRELRRRALANKRSVGAETLRAWKWDENAQHRSKLGEAPWM